MECIEHDLPFALPRALVQAEDLTSPAAVVRAALFDGLSEVEVFAKGAKKSKRTVDAWIAQGMPTVRVGRTVYIPIKEARAWLLKPSTRCAAPRAVGRPRRAA